MADEKIPKDPSGGRRFLVFQRAEVVDSRRYVAGEVPYQWFTPDRVDQLTADGTAREATDAERDEAIARGQKGEVYVLAPRATGPPVIENRSGGPVPSTNEPPPIS